MEIEIKALDDYGRGIGYIKDKIIFIENSLPGEIVKIDITKDLSKYMEGTVKEYIKEDKLRKKSKCPYYNECGGCHLRHMSYEDTLAFKCDKVKRVIKKFSGLDIDPIIIKNKKKDFYRNKVLIKVRDGKVGFFKKGSHDLIEVDRCLIAEEAINSFLFNIDDLNINNADLTIKCNYNGEIIVVINTEEEPSINIEHLRSKNKLVGIIVNDKVIFGSNHFIEIIDNMFFKETYNSFFQVNRSITDEMFKIIKDNVDIGSTVLDLCSGVGTLSIVSSLKAKKVYGVEIVENAVRDALINAKMNNRDNVEFILGDAFKTIDKIMDNIDTILIDPPRSGFTKNGLNSIINTKAKKIIYISCNPVTLGRDLKELSKKYYIKKFYILDMFSYTYHVETVMVLERKDV